MRERAEATARVRLSLPPYTIFRELRTALEPRSAFDISAYAVIIQATFAWTGLRDRYKQEIMVNLTICFAIALDLDRFNRNSAPQS